MSIRAPKRILVTGGAGFIGSGFIRYLCTFHPQIEKILNLDLLTYASNLKSLHTIQDNPRYHFVRGDILNGPLVESLIRTYRIDAIVHFAAESHVDRSIESPHLFYKTNVEGTLSLLEVVRRFPEVHFHHVSTDEVFGSIEKGYFTETSPYRPNSPYAASKAASDHFVRAFYTTYGISVTLSHGSNTYGPFQHEEKLIPKMIRQCQKKEAMPLYGTGVNVRNWIHVDDHARGIWAVLTKGRRGESYNVCGKEEWQNIGLLKELAEGFAKAKKEKSESYYSLITPVKDRLGHDFRYALSGEKIKRECGWTPEISLKEGIEELMEEIGV